MGKPLSVLAWLPALGLAALSQVTVPSPVSWRFTDSGEPVPTGHRVWLFNTQTKSFLIYSRRFFGIALKFDPSARSRFIFERRSGRAEPVRYGEALGIKRGGGDYLVYAKRKLGVALGWTDRPSYEWEVRGGPPGSIVGEGDSTTTDVSLYNKKASAYLVHGPQHPGVDLVWQN